MAPAKDRVSGKNVNSDSHASQLRTNLPLLHRHPHPRAPQPGHISFHSLDGTEHIGALVRAFWQHREVPRFQFFRAGVDQLVDKLFPTVQVRQGQHRTDGLAQPLTHLIQGLLHLLHDEPAAFEAFG